LSAGGHTAAPAAGAQGPREDERHAHQLPVFRGWVPMFPWRVVAEGSYLLNAGKKCSFTVAYQFQLNDWEATMEPDRHADLNGAPMSSTLLVADWMVEPEAVVKWCQASAGHRQAALRIVVPAWLHGLDWAGDPWASVPCAQRQMDRLAAVCAAAGMHVVSAAVGDPNPLSAVDDAVHAERVSEILLFARGRRFAGGHPLSLARRAQRLTGLPVHGITTPRAARRRRRVVLPGGYCERGQAQPA
jgi:hypothetical protein